jgi:hypothetical protein
MKTILRAADLTYDPSGKTVVFAQPWFRIEGLLAILNQTRGQVIYRTTDGWGGWNSGTKTLTLKSSVDTTGHSSGDSLQAIYEQPYENRITYQRVSTADNNAVVVKSGPGWLYSFKLDFLSTGVASLRIYDKATTPLPLSDTFRLMHYSYFTNSHSTQTSIGESLPEGGVFFENGISISITTTHNNNTSVAANSWAAQLIYS